MVYDDIWSIPVYLYPKGIEDPGVDGRKEISRNLLRAVSTGLGHSKKLMRSIEGRFRLEN
jgi:hypothetical protein